MRVTIELVEQECCNCHTTFAVTRELYAARLADRHISRMHPGWKNEEG